jgi:hypothetical protein
MESSDIVHSNALVAVDEPTGLRICGEPSVDSPTETPIIEPAWAISHLTQFMHGNTCCGFTHTYLAYNLDFVS